MSSVGDGAIAPDAIKEGGAASERTQTAPFVEER